MFILVYSLAAVIVLYLVAFTGYYFHNRYVDELVRLHRDDVFLIPPNVYPMFYIKALSVMDPNMSVDVWANRGIEFIRISPTGLVNQWDRWTRYRVMMRLKVNYLALLKHSKHRFRWTNRSGIDEISYAEVYSFSPTSHTSVVGSWKLMLFPKGIRVWNDREVLGIVSRDTLENDAMGIKAIGWVSNTLRKAQ